jgi:hypothetical protein
VIVSCSRAIHRTPVGGTALGPFARRGLSRA